MEAAPQTDMSPATTQNRRQELFTTVDKSVRKKTSLQGF